MGRAEEAEVETAKRGSDGIRGGARGRGLREYRVTEWRRWREDEKVH